MAKNPAYSQYSVGRYSYGYPEVTRWDCCGTLKVGSFCSFAANVKILLGGEHRTDWVTTFPLTDFLAPNTGQPRQMSFKGDVIIGNDVWVGDGALILSGVTIGDGAVIAARSVVAKDVEPYSIVGGVPSKIIRKRFPNDVCDTLREIAWWNWDDSTLRAAIPLLLSNDISGFIKEFSHTGFSHK
jgi:acetyltransferase-like isoleucine patch superfamily enzyme